MPAGDEIMTPVTKPEAVSMAEIHAMRQLTDAVSSLGRQIERMNGKIDDVRERVIKLESREYERQIEKLEHDLALACARIDKLEQVKDRQDGALSVGGWISKYAPWLVAMIMAGLAGVGWKDGVSG